MKKLNAFTLAEVLITLAIIGVVAAITIPTLVTYNQEKGWNTSSTVFERKLGEALSIMNTQQTLAGLGTTENFVAELSKHFKIVNTCDNTNLSKCFESSITWSDKEKNISKIKTSKDFGWEDWNTNIVGFQSANGVNGLIAYNPDCKSNPYSNQIIQISGGVSKNNGSVKLGTDCIAILYDVQGFSKPNTQGKDVRALNVAFPAEKVCLNDGSLCFKGPAVAVSGLDCTNTSSSDHKYCEGSTAYSNDKWAGSAKACGGKGKMATANDLAKIAGEIYGVEVGTKDSVDEMQLGWDFQANADAMAKYGLTTDGEIEVFAPDDLYDTYGNPNNFYEYEGARGRIFSSSGTRYTGDKRNTTAQVGVICKE